MWGSDATNSAAAGNSVADMRGMGVAAASDVDVVIHIVDAAGNDLPGVELWLTKDSPGFPRARMDGSDRSVKAKTDNSGVAKVKFPKTAMNIVAIKAGFARSCRVG